MVKNGLKVSSCALTCTRDPIASIGKSRDGVAGGGLPPDPMMHGTAPSGSSRAWGVGGGLYDPMDTNTVNESLDHDTLI